MRFAVLADVHGNLPALEAVIAALPALGVEAAVDLGDRASGPLWPAETVALLRKTGFAHVRGNHDRALGSPDGAGLGPSDAYAFTSLGPEARHWLATLPPRLDWNGALCLHASPGDDEAYLMEEVVGGRLVPAAGSTIRDRLAGTQSGLVLCAHSHQPRLVQLRDGTVLVNPGSVGCPAYRDESAPAHVSESGAPHARFAVVTTGDTVTVAHHAVAYDWHAAAGRARANGRPDWERALLTGWAA